MPEVKRRRHRSRDEREQRLVEGQEVIDKLIAGGWMPRYLAEEIGIAERTLYSWRYGESPPPESKLQQLRELVR